jgi:hypothetical protein
MAVSPSQGAEEVLRRSFFACSSGLISGKDASQTMWILLPLGCFGLAVFLHGIAMRLPLRIDPVRRFLMVGVPIGAALVAFSLATLGLTIHAFAAILLYAFLCELYMFFFTLVISSVSVTMLIMLRRGAVEVSALTSTYDPRGMVKLRLDRLIKNGLIGREGDRLIVTSKGMWLHRVFGALRRFFAHDLP